MSPIIAEEHAVLRVSYIVVNLQRVGMVRQVPHREREANCMMRAYIEIFGGPYVCREIARVARLVGGKRNVVLDGIHGLPGKPVAILNVRCDSYSPWQDRGSPQQEAVQDLSEGAGDDRRTYHRKGEVTQITGYIGLVAAGRLADIRKKELALLTGSDSRRDIHLTALQSTRAAEYQSAPGRRDFRCKSELILSVRTDIADPEHERFIHLMLGLHIPGHAVRCEISALDWLNDQWKPGVRCGAGDVPVASWPVGNIAATVVCRDDLLRVAAERISIEWQGVIKDPDTTANDSGVIRAGRPGKPGARREPACMGKRLSLPAQPGVCGNMSIENPMILSVDGRFKI